MRHSTISRRWKNSNSNNLETVKYDEKPRKRKNKESVTDIYAIQHLRRSEKMRVASLDDATDIVRGVYPNAYREGSSGLQWSFWIVSARSPLLVAKARILRRSTDWWLWFDEDDDTMRAARLLTATQRYDTIRDRGTKKVQK